MKRASSIFFACALFAGMVNTSYAADIRPALTATFGNEGGYQCDRTDPGNWTGGKVGAGELVGTKYGIAANSYPHEDIRNLTIDRAAQLYERDYWRPLGLDKVNSQIIANEVFDWAVNQGTVTVARLLQHAINLAMYPYKSITEDGKIGPATIAALNSRRQDSIYVCMIGLRFKRYEEIATKNPRMMPYFRAWIMRIKSNVRAAVHAYDQYLEGRHASPTAH